MFAPTRVESDSHPRPYEIVATPDQVPLYDLVPVQGPEGEPLAAYRGVRRRDTSEIVSVVSARYQLVQHREVAAAVHAIGEALKRIFSDVRGSTRKSTHLQALRGAQRSRSAPGRGRRGRARGDSTPALPSCGTRGLGY